MRKSPFLKIEFALRFLEGDPNLRDRVVTPHIANGLLLIGSIALIFAIVWFLAW